MKGELRFHNGTTLLTFSCFSTLRCLASFWVFLLHAKKADLGRYSIVGDKGFFPGTHNSSQVYLAQWLHDTPVYYDAFEIIAEKARRYWWGQQIDLGTVSWSLLLAIEGRRRHIPLLTAFLALAHLVSLSFAQNLFYLALLLTPAPIGAGDDDLALPVVPLPRSKWTRIRDAILPPKPTNWCPHPILFLGVIFLNAVSLFVLPYTTGTDSFVSTILFARLSTFLPLIIPQVVPVSWGTVHPHPHDAYSSFTTLFRLLSFTSLVLHGKATFLGLRYNLPGSHYHRHSRFLPWDIEERSTVSIFGFPTCLFRHVVEHLFLPPYFPSSID
jgi:hypothetical protein